ARDLLERLVLDAEAVGYVVAQLGDHALAPGKFGKRAARDGERLQHRHGRHHFVGAQGLERAVGRTLRPDHGRERHQQLAHVTVKAARVARRLGEVEVEQPWFARFVYELVVATKIAVGDARRVQTFDLFPNALEQLVVDALDRN